MASTRIAELAACIQQRTSEIDSYLQYNQLPSPSFDEDGPAELKLPSGELSAARDQGWSHYHNTDKAAWEYYALHPDKARRFAGAMSSFANGHSNSPTFLVQNYPWNRIGTGTVVDVGGSKGNISVLLAKQFPDLSFIIQDLPEMISGVSDTIPAEFQSRIQFQEHDFFTEQPVHGADVYLFRNIFHDCSDSHAIRILKALVPGLRPGSRLVINDYILPEPGTLSLMKERAVRDMDMIMLTLFNSREREEADWVELFRQADPRFEVDRIWTPQGATMGIIEVLWPLEHVDTTVHKAFLL